MIVILKNNDMLNMNIKEKFGIGLTIIIFVLLLLGGIGWIKNIVKLVHLDFDAPYKAEVIRIVGVVPAVGAITGWITIND